MVGGGTFDAGGAGRGAWMRLNAPEYAPDLCLA